MDNYYGDGGALIQDPINALIYYSGGTVVSGSYSVMSVSKSTDGGTTWPYRYHLTTSYGLCYALAVDPTNNNIVYAGGDGGLFKSTNAGANWASAASGLSGIVYDIKINPQNTNLIYAGTSSSVFRSTDAGANWTDVGCDSVTALLINAAHPDTIYAATGYGVFMSTNAGTTWSPMNSGLNTLKIKALTANPGNYLFCGTDAGAYRWPMAVTIEECPNNTRVRLNLEVYPNPFRKTACISAGCTAKNLQLQIFDLTGRLVLSRTLCSTPFAYYWNGTDQSGGLVPDGIYFVQATDGIITETRSLLLMR